MPTSKNGTDFFSSVFFIYFISLLNIF